MQVWKYPLEVGEQIIEMPANSEPIYVAVQGGKPCLWVEVDPEAPKGKRRIKVIGTGWDLDEERAFHVGSFQLEGGLLVFHVYDCVWSHEKAIAKAEGE